MSWPVKTSVMNTMLVQKCAFARVSFIWRPNIFGNQ
jgi:hypothetical protein